MGLRRIGLWGMLLLTLWLLPGCSDSSSAVPSVWGGAMTVSGSSAELREVRWEKMPSWEDWAKLPQKKQIAIHGLWQMTEAAEPVPFLCRLSWQSGTSYKIHFNTSPAEGQALTAAGEVDWVQQSAAVDFHGVFTPEQYRSLLKILPDLQNGSADVRGSMLCSGAIRSYPLLSITPSAGSVLQMGALPLTGGRLERRETFSEKVAFTLYGMAARIGGVKIVPQEIYADRLQAEFKAAVEPDAPWQCTIPLQGDGRCSLTGEDRSWTVAAELPEAGVFRLGALILPLRSCRIQGGGDKSGGKWSFNGEGASCSFLLPSGNLTGSNVRIRGERQFLAADKGAVFLPDKASFACGKAEIPNPYGRISVSQYHGDFQVQSAGCLQYTGKAGGLIWELKNGGEIRLEDPEWDFVLLKAGKQILSPEKGFFRAKKIAALMPQWQAVAESAEGTLIAREHDWELGISPGRFKISRGDNAAFLQNAELKLTGSRGASGIMEIRGRGRSGKVQTGWGEGAFGVWNLHAGMSPDAARCNFISWSSGSWQGKIGKIGSWQADKISVEADRGAKDIWKGKVAVAGGGAKHPDFSAGDLRGQLPFGGGDAAGCKIEAAQLRYRGLGLTGVQLDLQNAPEGISLRGRGKYEWTGGACFISGDVRRDLKQGALEYAIPMATLQKELKAADFVPLAGGWHFSGKLGDSGRIYWENGFPQWRHKCTFSGFARNAFCMIEDISGQLEPVNGEIVDGRLLFRRLTSAAGECTEGELIFRTANRHMILQDARFEAWGGRWKLLKDGEFQVKGISLAGLLPLAGWQKAVSGRFSGSILLDEHFSVRKGDLKSDASGSLALSGLESYRLLPAKDLDTNILAFTTAAFRHFLYRSLALRIVSRKNSILLRFLGEGRPAEAVPFVLEKDGFFRPAVPGERGFDGNVEIGCGYKIPRQDLQRK